MLLRRTVKFAVTSVCSIGLCAVAVGCNAVSADLDGGASPLPETTSQPNLPDHTASSAETEPPFAPRRGPWEEFNASLFGTGLTEEEAFRRNHEERVIMEDFVAQCMREQGFEYIPFPGPGEYHASGLSNFRWDDRDWVAQYGFGIVNSPSHTSGGAGAPADPPELVDPNLEYGNNLPQAERDAWHFALDGGTGPDRVLGCRDKARELIATDTLHDLMWADEFQPLWLAGGAMQEKFYSEITPAQRDWANCMADAGFPTLELQSEAGNLVIPELQRLEGLGLPANAPEFAALADQEVNLALADFDCRAATNFDDRQFDWQVELETQFMDDHHAEIEALKDAVAQRS